MSKFPYSSAIGSQMYTTMYTRLDICFMIGLVSCYQLNPERKHWKAIKRIVRISKTPRAIPYILKEIAYVWIDI